MIAALTPRMLAAPTVADIVEFESWPQEQRELAYRVIGYDVSDLIDHQAEQRRKYIEMLVSESADHKLDKTA